MGENAATIVIRAKDEATSVIKNVIKDGISALISPVGLAIAAMAALGTAFNVATEEAVEAEVNLSQLRAVLKSTGEIAGVTEKKALDLADGLSKTTAFSDDAILSAENLLLTFTKIGKNIFPDAIKITADLATALKMDLNGAAIQVGKALNDPVKGVAALGRAGVQFSDDQKNVIKSLVDTGNVAGAQKIILQELETQVGESASAYGKTFTGQVEIAKNAILNISESIGTKILPVLKLLVGEFSKLIGPIASAFDSKPVNNFFTFVQIFAVNFISTLKSTFAIAESIIKAPFSISVYITVLQEMGDFIIGFFGAMFNAIKKIASGGIGDLINYFKNYSKATENEAEKLTGKLAKIEENRKKQINAIFAQSQNDQLAIHAKSEINKTKITNENIDSNVKKHQKSEEEKNKITKEATDFKLKTISESFDTIVAKQTDNTQKVLDILGYQTNETITSNNNTNTAIIASDDDKAKKLLSISENSALSQIGVNNNLLQNIIVAGATANDIRFDNERNRVERMKNLEVDLYKNNKELIDILSEAEGDKNSKILDYVKQRIKMEIAAQAAAAIVKIGIYGLEYAIPSFGASLVAAGAGIAGVAALATGAGAVVDETIDNMKPKEREADKINRELDEEKKLQEYVSKKDAERKKREGTQISTSTNQSISEPKTSNFKVTSTDFGQQGMVSSDKPITINVMLDKQILGKAIVDLKRQQEAGLL